MKTKSRHQKKLNSLITNKRINEGTHKNFNRIIANLSDIVLSDNKISVLKLGLKHEILISPKETEMVVIIEDFYDQIVRRDLLKKNNISKHRAQTALKSFSYSYLDLDL